MSQVILITGSSSGFGYDAALRLARRGHRVFATMRATQRRNAGARAQLEQIAAAEPIALQVLDLDVTDDASVQAAVDATVRAAGRIDVVVNNAGVAGLGVTEGYTPEQFEQMFDVNVFGVVRVNRAVLPIMRQQRSGLLVHVSSGAGRVTVPTMAAYCASKFALEAVADAYRYELLPFGIDSVLLEPGIYKTPIFDKIVGAADATRVSQYSHLDFAERVAGVFQAVSGAPDNPGTSEFCDALVEVIEMEQAARPFRTPVGTPMHQLLDGYNAAADALRPVVAQVFGVPELAGAPIATA